ncbi:MAG: hypothetical protein FJ100_23925 [Deltaproteobacteria bacterium]|nr:hypothetical protein [Deltaproteobacteria bacterium]
MGAIGRFVDRIAAPRIGDNAPRWPGSGGHVESWFVRANDPNGRRALWCKLTILSPLQGDPVAEAWAIAFDGDRTLGLRSTVPLRDADVRDPVAGLRVADCRMDLGAPAAASGSIAMGSDCLRWDLTWAADAGNAGAPLSLLPSRLLLRTGFPRSKLLTPCPAATFSGTFWWDDHCIRVDGWRGMQGHNWGREHAAEYAWGQCLFDDAPDGPVMAEAVTARLRVAGRLTPPISGLVVRQGGRQWRFDALVDLWRQEAQVGERDWTLRMRGPDGAAELRLDGGDAPFACLGYGNPDGTTRYCWNTKLARAELRVEPRNGRPFSCASAHGGALELLRPRPIAGALVV